jgi:hypothetical protein
VGWSPLDGTERAVASASAASSGTLHRLRTLVVEGDIAKTQKALIVTGHRMVFGFHTDNDRLPSNPLRLPTIYEGGVKQSDGNPAKKDRQR